MRNPRITDKEWGLIKGALRRVFSRSDLRRSVLIDSQVPHTDPKRPRVTKWSKCAACLNLSPSYQCECDHIDPIVPVTVKFIDMEVVDLLDRLWCTKDKLQILCTTCHKAKSKLENAQRRKSKK